MGHLILLTRLADTCGSPRFHRTEPTPLLGVLWGLFFFWSTTVSPHRAFESRETAVRLKRAKYLWRNGGGKGVGEAGRGAATRPGVPGPMAAVLPGQPVARRRRGPAMAAGTAEAARAGPAAPPGPGPGPDPSS